VVDTIKIAYELIKELSISKEEKEPLFKELAEFGFTDRLKIRLLAYLDREIQMAKDRLHKLRRAERRITQNGSIIKD
jgi:hypothetical protein